MSPLLYGGLKQTANIIVDQTPMTITPALITLELNDQKETDVTMILGTPPTTMPRITVEKRTLVQEVSTSEAWLGARPPTTITLTVTVSRTVGL